MELPRAPAPAPVNPDAEIREFADEVNDHRRKVGCPPLTWNPNVARVAQNHSAEMARFKYFSHTDRQGRSVGKRMDDAGIRWSRTAENIAAGQRDADEVLASWLSSPGHRKNIENCAYTLHGVGMAEFYWTHDFLTPR